MTTIPRHKFWPVVAHGLTCEVVRYAITFMFSLTGLIYGSTWQYARKGLKWIFR